MPRLIDCPDGPVLSLGDAAAAIEAAGADLRDEDEFAALGPILAGLSRDRDFLGDIAIAELEVRCANQVRDNAYGPQVMLLHAGGKGWFLRANLWPAAGDSIVAANSEASFFYHVPHDHNFSFLTVGYFGPGYESEYWDYDYDTVSGAVGEAVALRPAGRHRLEPGRVMLYRAHRDVHSQRPPESLSVTLNIVESDPRVRWRDQYRFDVDRGLIAGLANPLSTATLLPLAAHLGGDGARGVLADIARDHPSDRLRFAAIAAAASASPDLETRVAVLSQGTGAATAYVREMSRRAIDALEAQRTWITRNYAETDAVPRAAGGAAT